MPFKTLQDALGSAFAHFTDYESPAEEMLGERVRTALAPGALLDHQIWVETIAGNFRLDMRLTTPQGKRVAIEVDGREYHEGKRDFWRSILILGAGAVNTVYRVTAVDLHRDLVGVLHALATAEPSAFLPSVTEQWATATDSSWAFGGRDDDDDDIDTDRPDNDEDPEPWSYRSLPATLSPMRLDSPGWSYLSFYRFAQQSGADSVEALMQAWDERPQSTL